MRKFLILAAGIAAFTSFAPASYAQSIGVDTPVGGVRIGEIEGRVLLDYLFRGRAIEECDHYGIQRHACAANADAKERDSSAPARSNRGSCRWSSRWRR